MDSEEMLEFRRLCFRLEKAKIYFENPLISDEEKECQQHNLTDLEQQIDNTTDCLYGQEFELAIEILKQIYSGGAL